MKLSYILSVLLIANPSVVGAVHSVPGNTEAILFTPCQWSLGYDVESFKLACKGQGYYVTEVRDLTEDTTPTITPQQFRDHLQAGYGEWFINSHGSASGFVIAAYESTTAGINQRNADFDYWNESGFDSCIYKSEIKTGIHGVGISYRYDCIDPYYADVGGEVCNASCFSAVNQDVAWPKARVNEGYLNSNNVYGVEADRFWQMRNGDFGRAYRTAGAAGTDLELKVYGDTSMVLAPTVSEIYPENASSVGVTNGYVVFDCDMDTDVPATELVHGYGDLSGGWINVGCAAWTASNRLEYCISPQQIGSGCGVYIDSGLARTTSGQYLDGNEVPAYSDGRGPNRDRYKVMYYAAEIDTDSAAGFEGAGAFADALGGHHLWWVTDPERGSTKFTLYGDEMPLKEVDAQGGTDQPHFYEAEIPGGYDYYWIVETDDDPVTDDSRTRPFPVTERPENLDELRKINTRVINRDALRRSPAAWDGPAPSKSASAVYDCYYVSRFQDLLNATAPVRSWWSDHGMSSTTVLVSSSNPDELHAFVQSVYQDAISRGRTEMPMFVIVGEANEGLEPEKNIIGMYVPEDYDGGCWWNCASDAMTFDVDGDIIADLPWSRVIGYTYDEIVREVSSTMDWLDGRYIDPVGRTLFTVGDRTPGCTVTAEPSRTLMAVQDTFEARGVPTSLLLDSDYSCYDEAGRLRDWCAGVDAGIGGIFLSGQVSNRSNWCYFPTWTENPPFAFDSLHTKQRFLLHGPGCGIGDAQRNNPDWYPSLIKTFMAADPATGPSIVAGCAHLVGGWETMHMEWAKMYTKHLFSGDVCYQKRVFAAYREMAEGEESMRPYLLGIGVYGFPVTAPGSDYVGIGAAEPLPAPATTLISSPNPFNPSTLIRYELPGTRKVTLEILDIAGRRVKTLAGGEIQDVGIHTVLWQGKNDSGDDAASGVYFAILRAGSDTRTRKLMLIR